MQARQFSLVLAAGIACGCVEFEPGSDTFESVYGNLGSTSPEGENWGCLDERVERPYAPVFSGTAPQVIYRLQMVDLSSGVIYRNIELRACALTDVTCANPLTDVLRVNEQGVADIPLFQNFTGYLEITSSELVPQIFYLNEPLQPQSEPEFPLSMVALTNLPPLAQLVGVELRPTAGLIALRIFDCQADTAAGVSLTTNSAAVPWYFVDGLPSSQPSQTGSEGLAGFVNVPPGLVVFEGTTRSGATIGGARSIIVRPGWMSSMYVRPPGVQSSAP